MPPAKHSDPPVGILRGIRFLGQTTGQIKKLSGFKKGIHALPTAATPTTNAFLGKICDAELKGEAETFFQKSRTLLNYKRKDLQLTAANGSACLLTRDFSLEWQYLIEEETPDCWCRTLILHSIQPEADIHSEAFDEIFSGTFDRLEFTLSQAISIEEIIDTIEALSPPSQLQIDYPSDCKFCTLIAPDITAKIIFTNNSVEMNFPRPGSPGALFSDFLRLRQEFSIHQASGLSPII